MFVIASTGRSGTTYIARLLTSCGIPCGHELVFGPRGMKEDPRVEGDCSWMALPYLEAGYKPDTLLHQVRDPIKTVGSFLGLHFFDGLETLYTQFARRHFDMEGPETALRFWVEWNRRIEALSPAFTYRVEDACPLELSTVLGLPLNRHWRREWDRISGNKINSQGPVSITWDDIPECRVKDEARYMAEGYGYACEDQKATAVHGDVLDRQGPEESQGQVSSS